MQDFAAYSKFAGEIECAFLGESQPDDVFWQAVKQYAEENDVLLDEVGKESESGQYELRFKETDPWKAASDVVSLKEAVLQLAEDTGYDCSFAAKPEGVEFSNGLHMHMHLVNHQDQYVFIKKDDEMSPPLRHTLGGMMETMYDFMLCFAPSENSFERILSGSDYVPQTVSWGGNNRTVALRLPESVVPWRHIEHRVAGADADPYAVTWALLVGTHYGLTEQPDPGQQIFGRAFDPTYELERLPESHRDAEIAYSGSEIVAKYGSEDIRRVLFSQGSVSESGAA